MQGHIRKRGKGSWTVVVDLGRDPVTEKRRQLWRSVKGSKRDAEALLVQLLHQRDRGIDTAPGRLTLGQYLNKWLGTVRPSLRPRTFVRYEEYVRLHIVPLLGGIALTKLSPQHLQQLYADRLEAGLSPTSVAHLHAVLHRALGQAARWGLVARNVASLATRPRIKRQEMVTLSPEEARALLAAAGGDRLEALYVLALSSGMRQGELLALRWRDVDLEMETIQVRATLQRAKDGFVFSEPKSARSRRQVALTKVAVAALRRHRVAQAEERLRLGSVWEDNDLVFPNEVGRPAEATNLVRRSYHPLLERAGLPRIRFHDLRHTAATLMLGRSVHPKVVAEMLGHSQIAVTLDLYSHVTPTMQRQATEALDAVLGA